MHNPDYSPNSTLSSSGNSVGSSQIQFRFTPSQEIASNSCIRSDQKLSELIANKVRKKEFFYGIEISAHNFGTKKAILDYKVFSSMLPLFTSLIWFGADYAQVDRITEVESIRSARELEAHTNVLPHFTAYRVNKERLSEYLNLNFSNVLVLRGDQFDPSQKFKYAADMVAEIRKIRGDTISIGVGGYPEGHADSKTLDEDIDFLSQKVNAGADFIITQVCFSSETVISFVRRCGEKGIKVPIIVGILVPDNERSLKRMMDITGARLPRAQMESYKMLKNDQKKFRDYAVDSAVKMISEVLSSNLNIYGIHFFTLNRFTNVDRVLQKLNGTQFTNEMEW